MVTRATSYKAVYREVQRLAQPWIWAVVLLPIALSWWGFVQQVLLGRQFGNRPASDPLMVVIWLAFGVGLPLLLAVGYLRTEVGEDALRLRFFPFWSRTVRIRDIRQCQPRTYSPVGEYWGWGIRWTPGHGWCYTVKGNRGVQLTLDGGKRLLVGSARPEELAAAINARRRSGPPRQQ